ncbi:MAG: phytoene/squalene synthase family protein [Planctomycetia bacterium]
MTALSADRAACADILRRSGSSFTLPIRLLPAEKRWGTTVLYAFCRRADDIVDDAPDRQAATGDLDEFSRQLRSAIDGTPVPDAVLRAVADTARRFGIPPGNLFDVIDGVRMDLAHDGFETFQDLEEYCRRVASAVGIAAIHIWGFRTADALPAAHACGLAFQLTNILRDVSEDRGRGRLYLAREDLHACGCKPEDVLAGRVTPAFARVVSLYQTRTLACYRHAARLDRMLSTDGRLAFRAMFAAYRALFAAVCRAGDRILTQRVRPNRARLVAATLAGVVSGPRP